MTGAMKAKPIARFRIENWMACGPGLETREDWISWSRGARNPQDSPAEPAVTLPPMLRRRISVVGQMAFRAGYLLGEQQTARFIFCSRHGEFDRTLRILNSLAAREPISPADFSLSVHNALAGLLSIAWSNTAGHTAIAAGADSFGYGLLESVACLNAASGERVMLVYFDDLLPSPYDEIGDGPETCVALAILLNGAHQDGEDFSVELGPRDRTVPAQSASGQALDFIKFMLSGESEKITVGERTQWRWQRCG